MTRDARKQRGEDSGADAMQHAEARAAATDRLAREAARLVQTGRAAHVQDAIRMAQMQDPDAAGPSVQQVRRHARAMAMQHLGEAGYEDAIIELWRAAEQMMHTLEHVLPEARTMLVGRAAAGLIDAGVVLHIRVFTDATAAAIAEQLVAFGVEEPTFRTVETRAGRMNQILFTDSGFQFVLMRIPLSVKIDEARDVFHGKPIRSVSSAQLAQMIAKRQGRRDQAGE